VEAERLKPLLNDCGDIKREVSTEKSRLFSFIGQWVARRTGAGIIRFG